MPKVSYYNSLLFEIYAPEKYEMFLYKHTETTEYVKKQPNFLRKIRTPPVYNSVILGSEVLELKNRGEKPSNGL